MFFLGKREGIYKTKTCNSDFCVFFAANVCRFPILEHWFLAGKFGARFSEMYIRPIFSTAISKKGRADGPTVAEAKGGIQVESHNDLIVGIFGGFFFWNVIPGVAAWTWVLKFSSLLVVFVGFISLTYAGAILVLGSIILAVMRMSHRDPCIFFRQIDWGRKPIHLGRMPINFQTHPSKNRVDFFFNFWHWKTGFDEMVLTSCSLNVSSNNTFYIRLFLGDDITW